MVAKVVKLGEPNLSRHNCHPVWSDRPLRVL
jgi:hypothetical protein